MSLFSLKNTDKIVLEVNGLLDEYKNANLIIKNTIIDHCNNVKKMKEIQENKEEMCEQHKNDIQWKKQAIPSLKRRIVEAKSELISLRCKLNLLRPLSSHILDDAKENDKAVFVNVSDDSRLKVLQAFKIIYSALCNAQNTLFKSNFLSGKNKLSDEKLYELILIHAEKKTKSRTATAYKLALEYVADRGYKELTKKIHTYGYQHSGRFFCFMKRTTVVGDISDNPKIHSRSYHVLEDTKDLLGNNSFGSSMKL